MPEPDIARVREFEAAALPHAEGLLRTALRLARGDRAAADDLVQETFMQGWKAFDQFERGTNCRGWLFRIMFNLSNRRFEKARSRPEVASTDDFQPANVVSMHIRPPQLTAAEVLEAFDNLPTDQSTILLLSVVEGFTCKEIALMLAVPIGTVMSRLSRGREALRKALSSTSSDQTVRSNVG